MWQLDDCTYVWCYSETSCSVIRNRRQRHNVEKHLLRKHSVLENTLVSKSYNGRRRRSTAIDIFRCELGDLKPCKRRNDFARVYALVYQLYRSAFYNLFIRGYWFFFCFLSIFPYASFYRLFALTRLARFMHARLRYKSGLQESGSRLVGK